MPRVTQAHFDARRRQILLAAHRRFAKTGFHGTTMEDVAGEAGISVGTLYRYFDGKEALIDALAAMGRTQKGDALERLDPGSSVEGLSRTVQGILGLLELDGVDDAVRLDVRLWGEALSHDTLRYVLKDSMDGLRKPIAEFISREMVRGGVRDDLDADAVARVVVAVLMGMEVQRLYDSDIDMRACSEAMAGLLQGLVP